MNPAWSYVLTLVGATALLVAGRKKAAGWVIAFCSQGLWATYAVVTHQPGFILGSLIYGYVYALNWFTWVRSDKGTKTKEQTPEQRLGKLADEMLNLASPDLSLADRVRYAEVLVRFSKTAAAWEQKQKTPLQRMARAKR